MAAGREGKRRPVTEAAWFAGRGNLKCRPVKWPGNFTGQGKLKLAGGRRIEGANSADVLLSNFGFPGKSTPAIKAKLRLIKAN